MSELYKVINDSTPLGQQYHGDRAVHIANGNSTDKEYYKRIIGENISRVQDTYEIQWADILTREEERVLKKILLKDYPDAGRKRGAILRYIKHFKTEPDQTGLKLYREVCKNQH